MFDDVVQYFGNQNKLAIALGVTRAAVSNWKVLGVFPPKQCFVIEKLSKGKFKAKDLVNHYYGFKDEK